MSYCEVSLEGVSEDAERVDWFDTREVSARKAYTCCECRSAITIGERHCVRVYRFNGKFNSERICDACSTTASEFDYTVFGGGLWSAIEEEWDQGARVEACIQRLPTVAAKTKMRDRWLRWKGIV